MESFTFIDSYCCISSDDFTLSQYSMLSETTLGKGAGEENPTIPTVADMADSQTYDLVIVGAGVAGFYALWKILRKQPKFKNKRILMLDQADQVGGRLRTDIIHLDSMNAGDIPQNYDFVACEEGGMRFCKLPPTEIGRDGTENGDQIMPLLIDLIDDLADPELSMEQFKVHPDGKIDFRRQWFYGTSFTNWYADENPGIWNQIFCLDADKTPDSIFKELYIRILEENHSKLLQLAGSKKNADMIMGQADKDMVKIGLLQSTEYWYQFTRYFTWENVPLYKYTMMSLMTRMGYSQGCIEMLQMTGYKCLTSGRGNAGTLIQMQRTMAVMSITDSFHCFTKGFSSLVYALQRSVKAILPDGWDATLRQKVVSVTVNAAGDENGPDISVLEVEDLTIGSKTKLRARNLILAIPRESFEKLEMKISGYFDGEAMSNQLRVLTDSVIDVEMTKINFYFAKPWWNTFGKHKLYGESTTNLPISMVYPFYDKNSDLCALTMYCDLTNSGFWSDLQSLPGVFTSELQSQYPKLTPASLDVVEEVIRELKILFKTEDIPYPLLTTYTRWDGQCVDVNCGCGGRKESCNNPVAIHQWKRGVDDREVRRAIARPFPRSRVFVCNEAWSPFQGWVEGSLAAVEEILKQF